MVPSAASSWLRKPTSEAGEDGCEGTNVNRDIAKYCEYLTSMKTGPTCCLVCTNGVTVVEANLRASSVSEHEVCRHQSLAVPTVEVCMAILAQSRRVTYSVFTCTG